MADYAELEARLRGGPSVSCDCERGHNGLGRAGRVCDCTLEQQAADAIATLRRERDEALAECASEEALQEARDEGYREGRSDASGAQADLWTMLLSYLEKHGNEPASDDGEGHTAYQMMDALHEHEAELKARIDALEAENARMREALVYYASPSDYVAPLTGGMGKLWKDCGETARAALGDSHE